MPRDTQFEGFAPQDDAEGDLVGAVVADRYRVIAHLGSGGIGRVFTAIQEPLGRKVALKVLHPDLSARFDMTQRFEREARAASRLAHPGSVMVFDFGSWNGLLYLAMELVDGPSLADLIEREFPLTCARVVELSVLLCDALEAAHAQGLLHRDLKPENILISKTPDGREQVKVCDYGLAFVIGEEGKTSPRLTREGTVAGPPTFMAPEQILNKPLDQRADLYALGCVIYEMLAGVPPFMGESSMEVLTKQLYDEPDPPSKRTRFPIPRDLEQVVLWPLQKSPGNRPQNAAELRAALLRAMDSPSRRTTRPSHGEVPFLDREQRAELAGMAPRSRSTSEGPFSTHTVLVVEPPDTPFESSASMVLRAQGSLVRVTSAIDKPGAAEALVVDVRRDPMAGVEEVGRHMEHYVGRAVLVVGTDDAFDAMTRALELKVAEYIPESQLGSLPRKLHRAIERARRTTRS
ncbi:MAG TPA: serine/threonine-protein kinase [Myxococcota bacterium]|nr:serine/threonine-protein kinase [Myxococcota bacterium]